MGIQLETYGAGFGRMVAANCQCWATERDEEMN